MTESESDKGPRPAPTEQPPSSPLDVEYRSVQWLETVTPVVVDPSTPGVLDFPALSSSVDQAAVSGDSVQAGLQSPPQSEASS
jgi:hypothetical protein